MIFVAELKRSILAAADARQLGKGADPILFVTVFVLTERVREPVFFPINKKIRFVGNNQIY